VEGLFHKILYENVLNTFGGVGNILGQKLHYLIPSNLEMHGESEILNQLISFLH